MNTPISASILALFCAVLATPASAQMCGGKQAQTSANTMSSGMMCGAAQAADDPMADKPAQAPKASGMCPCCKNMAMMKGGTGGSMHHDMPGMDTPKAQ